MANAHRRRRAALPFDSGPDASSGPSTRLSPDERDLLRAWASSRGGAVIAEPDLGTLSETIARAASPPIERRVVRPMRSPWWIVPFGLALGAEWWLRRRRGGR